MGLRMYRDADEIEPKQPTIKTDPTAPARSAIRRQRTVRYSPNTRQPTVPTISSTIYRPGSNHARMRAPSDRRSLFEDIPPGEGPPPNPFQHTAAEVTNLVAALQGQSTARAADIVHNQASQRSRRESGRAFLRDALSYERPGERIRLDRDTTVPDAPETLATTNEAPEEELINATHQHGEEVSVPRRDHWPTPPYSAGESSESSPMSRSTPPLGTASLTPWFAPAHGLSSQLAGNNNETGHTLATRRASLALLAERIPSMLDGLNDEDRTFLTTLASELDTMRDRTAETLTAAYLEGETAYLRTVEARLRLLSANASNESTSTSSDDLPAQHLTGQQLETAIRRAAVQRQFRRSQRARARQDMLDGLGDRQRSFSPDNDAWETMLTTITPDERVPSAHSSFTTATASASASAASRSSNSASSSYGTAVTVPSTHPDSIEVCPAEGSATSTDGDDDDEMFSVVEVGWPLIGGGNAGGGGIVAAAAAEPSLTPNRMIARRRHRRHRQQQQQQQEAAELDNMSSTERFQQGHHHQSRMEHLARRIRRQRDWASSSDWSDGRRARNIERDEELRRMERSLLDMESQLEAERSVVGQMSMQMQMGVANAAAGAGGRGVGRARERPGERL